MYLIQDVLDLSLARVVYHGVVVVVTTVTPLLLIASSLAIPAMLLVLLFIDEFNILDLRQIGERLVVVDVEVEHKLALFLLIRYLLFPNSCIFVLVIYAIHFAFGNAIDVLRVNQISDFIILNLLIHDLVLLLLRSQRRGIDLVIGSNLLFLDLVVTSFIILLL